MGAYNFSLIEYGKDLTDAYNNAVDKALYQHGHDPYNGTISTCDKPRNVTWDAPRYGTKAFDKWLERQWDVVPKWQCRAVEITGKRLKEYRKAKGLERKRIKVYFIFGWAGC